MSMLIALAAALGSGAPLSTDCANSFEPIEVAAAQGKVIDLFSSARRPLVIVSIGGSARLPFTFDTGSSGNLVSMRIAKQLSLPENGPSPSVDGNGVPVPGFDTCLNGMTIGGVPGPDRRATAFPFDRVNEEGILSPMHFSGQVLKLDGPNLQLTVMGRENVQEPNESYDWQGTPGDMHPMIPISLGDVELEVRLDSGSDADLILPLEWMTRLELAEEPFVAGHMQTASTTTTLYGARLDGVMALGPDVQVDRPFLLFAETQTPLLGWPLMRSMTFYMDPERGLSWYARDACEEPPCNDG